MTGERLATRWGRRALTLPAPFLASALLLAGLPLLLPAALLGNAALRGHPHLVRLLAFALAWGVCEGAGLLGAGASWLRDALRRRPDRDAFLRANFRLQVAWARGLLHLAERILALRIELDEDGAPAGAPVVVFVRHASMIDSLLPTVLISGRHGTRLRFVMKRELLADPCLDVVGQRLPNAFVRRGGDAAEREAGAIAELATGLGPDEGVVVFPEGTRFTPAKRVRALARIEESGDAGRLARARALRHLLPPRSRGPLAVLDAAAGADVIFLAHRGFEGAASLRTLPSLVGRCIEVRTWRVPAADVPETDAERLAWLDAEWARMDRWLEEREAARSGEERP